jgi:hypothetical protein
MHMAVAAETAAPHTTDVAGTTLVVELAVPEQNWLAISR